MVNFFYNMEFFQNQCIESYNYGYNDTVKKLRSRNFFTETVDKLGERWYNCDTEQ